MALGSRHDLMRNQTPYILHIYSFTTELTLNALLRDRTIPLFKESPRSAGVSRVSRTGAEVEPGLRPA